MTTLTPEQRNYHYLLEAERTGIHQPLLAALYEAQGQPTLTDGETGLGISPAYRTPLKAVDTFPKQVHYAANTIRSLTGKLVAKGWTRVELWNAEQGRYTEKFIETVAGGYAPPALEPTAARLEACKANVLWQAYLKNLQTNSASSPLPQNLAYLDHSLLVFAKRIPYFYLGLPHQRDAMLEAVRIWCQLDKREAAIATLQARTIHSSEDEFHLDIPLKQFVLQISQAYAGYPCQREALIRLTQLWRQLPSRSAAIASLEKNTSAESGLKTVDPALIAFIQRLPQNYLSSGPQRNALCETFRLWRQLDSRTAALEALGIPPKSLTGSTTNQTKLGIIAAQLDRELLAFIRQVPVEYKELDYQRSALLHLVLLWRNLTTREQTIQSLFHDLKQMEKARRDAQEAPPPPEPVIIAKRPDRWTTQNICLSASIILDGSFTWAEATHGGMWMPPNQETVDAMVRIATLAQRARDRIGRPFLVTSWYLPPHINQAIGGAVSSRHIVGDALDFTCEGLSGNQIYWFLDPWWPGGLGRSSRFPNLCHIDARSYRARW